MVLIDHEGWSTRTERNAWWRHLPRAFSADEVVAELCASFPTAGFIRSQRVSADKSYELSCRPLVTARGRTTLDLASCWQSLVEELCDPGYRDTVGRAFGLDLGDATMEITCWRYDPGCFLGPHLDKPEKIVTQIFYFNETWREDWGGDLLILGGPSPSSELARIAPLAGASVLLKRCDTSWHAVRRVQSTDATATRRSLQVVFSRS